MGLWGQVAWIKADTKAVLAIHEHVITNNARLSVTHSDYNTWTLNIRGVRREDRGIYMCQVNTDPMKSQVRDLSLANSEYTIRRGDGGREGEGGGMKTGKENGSGSRESFYPRSGSDFYCTRCFRVEGIHFKVKSVLSCGAVCFPPLCSKQEGGGGRN